MRKIQLNNKITRNKIDTAIKKETLKKCSTTKN